MTVVFMAVVFLVQSFPVLLLLLLCTPIAACSAGRTPKQSLVGLRPILWLATVTAVMNALLHDGTPIAEAGLFSHLSREGVEGSVKMVLRLILLSSATSLLTFTTSPLSLMAGLERLMKPLARLGVPVQDLAMMMSLALRFVPVIVDEGRTIIRAQSSRSAHFNTGNPLQRAKSLLPLLVPLFVGVFRRGEELATAMEARCYRGSGCRTKTGELRFSAADLASVAITLALFAVLMLVEQLPL